VRFLCEFIGVIGVLECSFGVPFPPVVVAFFIMFGGSAMCVRGKFVLLRSLYVCVVHGIYRCAATTASGLSALASLVDAISCAPVCFNKSLARAIFSDESQ
jgi:hypothetical protein